MAEFKLFWKWWLNLEGSVISPDVFMQFNFVLGFEIVQDDHPRESTGGLPLHPFHICSYCSNNCTFFFFCKERKKVKLDYASSRLQQQL